MRERSVHVAVATRIGCHDFVTYDLRRAEVARLAGLPVTSPV